MHFIRSLGPAIAHASPSEAVRAGAGALVGLGVAGLFILSPTIDLDWGLYLVAPFGASAVLLFAVPNSPLAQPWSAIVGNTVAALVGIAVCMLISDPVLKIALAVGLSIFAMILCRAVHPPGGAVAMTAAMSPQAIEQLGFWFALSPIMLGTVVLVIIAYGYASLTGRHYPLRHFGDTGRHGTHDPDPIERLGLTEDELSAILNRYKQSFNVGAEDLARLIGAAELQVASHHTGPLIAKDIMSRNLITVSPDTSVQEIANLFRHHKFTSLPVVTDGARFLGVIFQIHLISSFDNNNIGIAHETEESICARDIMNTTGPRAFTDTTIGAFLPLMADGEVDAVPVIDGERIIGIVTRTDLISAMARSVVRQDNRPEN